MLEPRRLAAVAIASRVAELLGESVGKTVGYRLHLESRVGSETRLEVMTEAILTRRLQQDPSLSGVSVVVIDEFHERSIHADLALAFLKEAMLLREDIYVVVMSATIDAAALSSYLGDAPVYTVAGRPFPVAVSYAPELTPARAVLQALAQKDDGAILVFLPGIGDIRRTKQELAAALGERAYDGNSANADGTAGNASDGDVALFTLHSSVPLREQRAVLSLPKPSASGARAPRRVILSSAIAETSLTVPGVTTVIDCGFARINRMNVALGMEKLVTERESLFSAEQRAGRAGRLSPGRCIRLWNQLDALVEYTPPEITRADLVPLVLECTAWGVTAPEKIDWLTSPPLAAWRAAQSLLQALGCITGEGTITQKGHTVLTLALHPRLACAVLAGYESGALTQAVQCALRFSSYAQASPQQQQAFCADLERRVRTVGHKALPPGSHAARLSNAALLLAGFPDRIGRRLSTATANEGALYQFPNGRKATLLASKGSAAPSYLVAPEVDAGSTTARIYDYEPLEEETALAWLQERATTHTEVAFADDSGKTTRLVKTEYTAYGALVLKERKLAATAEDYRAAVCTTVQKHGIAWLPLNDASTSLLTRAQFLANSVCDAAAGGNAAESATTAAGSSNSTASARAAGSNRRNALPAQLAESAQALAEKLHSLSERASEWLTPFLTGGAVSESAVFNALHWYLDGALIDKHVPTHITLANGKSRRLSYERNGTVVTPVLEIIIQQIFGCFETPRVLGTPVLLKLLSPARRPLQITDDLAGFWHHTWPEICKEMKGRYPKHNWDYRLATT